MDKIPDDLKKVFGKCKMVERNTLDENVVEFKGVTFIFADGETTDNVQFIDEYDDCMPDGWDRQWSVYTLTGDNFSQNVKISNYGHLGFPKAKKKKKSKIEEHRYDW